jgi:hypothetical protein
LHACIRQLFAGVPERGRSRLPKGTRLQERIPLPDHEATVYFPVGHFTAGIVAAGVLVPLSLPLLLVFALVRWRRRRLSAPLAVG